MKAISEFYFYWVPKRRFKFKSFWLYLISGIFFILVLSVIFVIFIWPFVTGFIFGYGITD